MTLDLQDQSFLCMSLCHISLITPVYKHLEYKHLQMYITVLMLADHICLVLKLLLLL